MGAKVSHSTTNPLHSPQKTPHSFIHKRPKPITTQAKSSLPSLSTTPNHLTTQLSFPTCYSLTSQAGSLSSLTTLQNPNKDDFYEIYLVGSSSVGKTSLISQYCHGNFDPCTAPTIGFDFKLQKVKTATKMARLRIWDTPRQGDLAKVMDSCKGKRGFLIVYDVTDRESFNDLKALMNELRKFGSLKAQSFLVGNKADDVKNRQVKFCEGEKLAENEGFKFFEVSAKNEDDVQEIFQEMITGLVNSYNEEESIEMNILDQSPDKGTRIEDIELS